LARFVWHAMSVDDQLEDRWIAAVDLDSARSVRWEYVDRW